MLKVIKSKIVEHQEIISFNCVIFDHLDGFPFIGIFIFQDC